MIFRQFCVKSVCVNEHVPKVCQPSVSMLPCLVMSVVRVRVRVSFCVISLRVRVRVCFCVYVCVCVR